MKRWLGEVCVAAILALLFLLAGPATGVLALTTADVTVNASGAYVALTCSPDTYAFGIVATSSTTSTATGYFTVTNSSTVTTNTTIKVVGDWTSGGTGWTASDDGNAGNNTAALKASKNTGAFDVIVKKTAPFINIATSQGALTDFQWELRLLAPTEFSDGQLNSNTVRLTMTST